MKRYISAIFLAFLLASCADDDSDTFLVKGGDTSYSSDEDDSSSSSARFSSSSVLRSSSSSARSSSSLKDAYLEELSRNGPSESCDFGILRDSRDGQEYRTTVIGEQTWMAENLNYDSAGVCYGNMPEYCDVFGRMYSVDAGAKVCPEGWHLPSLEEWDVLFATAGGENYANRALISSYGWKEQMNVADSYCFTVLPGGYFDEDEYKLLKSGVCYWTSTSDGTYANNPFRNIYFDYERSYVYEGGASALDKMYIRCVKDIDE